jgi:hypothetical protein
MHWSISWARSIQSISPQPISLRSILILPPIYVLVFLVVSFLLAFPPIFFMHFSSPEFVLHAPQYAVFSSFLSLLLSSNQIFSSAPCSQTPWVYVPPLMSETKLHNDTEPQAKLSNMTHINKYSKHYRTQTAHSSTQHTLQHNQRHENIYSERP